MSAPAPPSRLLVVLDRPTCDRVGREPLELCRTLIDTGARFFWYRNHSDGAGLMLRDAGSLAAHIARSYGALVVGDRLDVALVAGAAGVHLPGHGLPVAAPSRFASIVHIGRSCHSDREVVSAAAAGATYVTLSPIYPTNSHDSRVRPPLGVDILRRVAPLADCPVLALGGVTPERAAVCRQAGAWGVAVLSGIVCADDPGEATAAYLEAVAEADA